MGGGGGTTQTFSKTYRVPHRLVVESNLADLIFCVLLICLDLTSVALNFILIIIFFHLH